MCVCGGRRCKRTFSRFRPNPQYAFLREFCCFARIINSSEDDPNTLDVAVHGLKVRASTNVGFGFVIIFVGAVGLCF